MAILAIDWGTKHIGLAVSYARVFAKELTVLPNSHGIFDELKRIIEVHKVTDLVVGLPKNHDGTDATVASDVRVFAQRLKQRTGLPVYFEDEHLTSKEAVRLLGGSVDPTSPRIDSFSAKLILEQYLARSANAK